MDLNETQYPQSRLADHSQLIQHFYGALCVVCWDTSASTLSTCSCPSLSIGFLNWLRHPLCESVQGLKEGFKSAAAGGNPAYASGCAYALMSILWAVAPLPEVLSSIGPPIPPPKLAGEYSR
jgi:hypothetical protein